MKPKSELDKLLKRCVFNPKEYCKHDKPNAFFCKHCKKSKKER